MRVLGTKATNNASSTLLDLEIQGLPKRRQDAIKQDVGEYLKEQVLLAVGGAKSPVGGEIFKALSKDYKAHKLADGGVGIPNLEKGGDMLDALDFKLTKDGIELGVFGNQAPKADGHLKFSGKKNATPQRRFLPGDGQSFKTPINKEVERIIGEHVMDMVDESELRQVKTKTELYLLFKELMPDASRADVRQFVLGNPKLVTLMSRTNKLGLL